MKNPLYLGRDSALGFCAKLVGGRYTSQRCFLRRPQEGRAVLTLLKPMYSGINSTGSMLVLWCRPKINRLGSDGLQWTWTENGKLRDANVRHAYRHGGDSFMAGSVLAILSVGFLTKIEGTMNSELYCEILLRVHENAPVARLDEGWYSFPAGQWS